MWHLTEVQHFWGTIVARGLVDRSEYVAPSRPPEGLLDEFDRAHHLLTGALRDSTDDTPVWTWAADAQHVGFVRRRQAHEALIHRLDAELASGVRTPLDAELATDGVDEALHVMFGGLPEWSATDELGPLGRVTAVDTGRTWLVQPCAWSGASPDTGTTYSSEPGLVVVDHGDPTFSISGTAGDLDAWLWSRPTVKPLGRDGDTSMFDALIAVGLQ